MKTPDAKSPRNSSSALTLGLALLIVVLDQLTKWLIVAIVMQPPRIVILAPFLDLVLARNPGVSFGMLRFEGAAAPWLLAGLALAIVAGLFLWQRRAGSLWVSVNVGLIAGGAIGNVIDRLRDAGVTDFIDLHWGELHWPAFNLADSAICVGVALLLAEALFAKRESPKT